MLTRRGVILGLLAALGLPGWAAAGDARVTIVDDPLAGVPARYVGPGRAGRVKLEISLFGKTVAVSVPRRSVRFG